MSDRELLDLMDAHVYILTWENWVWNERGQAWSSWDCADRIKAIEAMEALEAEHGKRVLELFKLRQAEIYTDLCTVPFENGVQILPPTRLA